MTNQNSDMKQGIARFYYESVLDGPETKKQGRQIYKQVEFVRITFPKNRVFQYIGEATDEHRERFSAAYENFKARQSDPTTGTPLKMVPIMTPADISMLEDAGIRTLESFAGMSASKVKKLTAHLQALHKKALAYLEAAENVGSLAESNAELQKRLEMAEADLRDARQTIADLTAALAAAGKAGKEAA